MLGFLFHKKREEVKRILHGRLNRTFVRGISANDTRDATRGTFTEVVWVLPCRSLTDLDYDRVFPAVTKDLSTQGISLVHDEPIEDSRVIVGLKDETDPRFMLCTLEHCTPIGYGFHHIGLHPNEVIRIDPQGIDAMREALKKYEEPAELQAAAAL